MGIFFKPFTRMARNGRAGNSVFWQGLLEIRNVTSCIFREKIVVLGKILL